MSTSRSTSPPDEKVFLSDLLKKANESPRRRTCVLRRTWKSSIMTCASVREVEDRLKEFSLQFEIDKYPWRLLFLCRRPKTSGPASFVLDRYGYPEAVIVPVFLYLIHHFSKIAQRMFEEHSGLYMSPEIRHMSLEWFRCHTDLEGRPLKYMSLGLQQELWKDPFHWMTWEVLPEQTIGDIICHSQLELLFFVGQDPTWLRSFLSHVLDSETCKLVENILQKGIRSVFPPSLSGSCSLDQCMICPFPSYIFKMIHRTCFHPVHVEDTIRVCLEFLCHPQYNDAEYPRETLFFFIREFVSHLKGSFHPTDLQTVVQSARDELFSNHGQIARKIWKQVFLDGDLCKKNPMFRLDVLEYLGTLWSMCKELYPIQEPEDISWLFNFENTHAQELDSCPISTILEVISLFGHQSIFPMHPLDTTFCLRLSTFLLKPGDSRPLSQFLLSFDWNHPRDTLKDWFWMFFGTIPPHQFLTLFKTSLSILQKMIRVPGEVFPKMIMWTEYLTSHLLSHNDHQDRWKIISPKWLNIISDLIRFSPSQFSFLSSLDVSLHHIPQYLDFHYPHDLDDFSHILRLLRKKIRSLSSEEKEKT